MGQNYGDCPLTLTKIMYWQFTGKLTLRGLGKQTGLISV